MSGYVMNDIVVCMAQDKTSAYAQLKKEHPGKAVSLDALTEITETQYNQTIKDHEQK